MISANCSVLKLLFHSNENIENDSIVFKGVVTDTRNECKGALFIALSGENFDGHDYVDVAYQNGAVIALVTQSVDSEIAQIVVEDTLVAYGILANYWRQHINPTVIAITGSNGKTTVKEMLASILSLENQVLATIGNFNNEVGVPQTLCELTPDDTIAIIEMGANHAEEIKRLSAIAEPNVVFVNNASATHVEGFGSLEGVRKAKGELYRYAQEGAIALINADDAAAEFWQKSSATKNIVMISCNNKSADISGFSDTDTLHVQTANEQFAINLKVKGGHNHSNALAAASLALAVNCTTDSIIKGLSQFEGFKGRLQFMAGINNSTIIDDSYNANPTSFKAGIDVLCQLPGKAWLAMGDMSELGENAQQEHDNVVDFAKHAGVDALFTKGEMSNKAARMMQKASSYESFEVMSLAIKDKLDGNVNLLVKGSRSANMDELVNLLSRGER